MAMCHTHKLFFSVLIIASSVHGISAKTTTSTSPFPRNPERSQAASASSSSTFVTDERNNREQDHGDPNAPLAENPVTADDITEALKAIVQLVLQKKEELVEGFVNWVKAKIVDILEKSGLITHKLAGQQRVRKSSPWTRSSQATDEDEAHDQEGRGSGKDDVLMSFMGRNLHYEDLHFVERIVLDAVDVIKAWQSRYGSDQ